MILYHTRNTIQILHLGFHDFTSACLSRLTSHTLPHSLSSIMLAFVLKDTIDSFPHQNPCLYLFPQRLFNDSLTHFVHFLAQILPLQKSISDYFPSSKPVIHNPHSLLFLQESYYLKFHFTCILFLTVHISTKT